MNSDRGPIEALGPQKNAELAKLEIDEMTEAVLEKDYQKAVIEAADALNHIVGAVEAVVINYRNREGRRNNAEDAKT